MRLHGRAAGGGQDVTWTFPCNGLFDVEEGSAKRDLVPVGMGALDVCARSGSSTSSTSSTSIGTCTCTSTCTCSGK